MAESKADELRRLAQAVADTWDAIPPSAMGVAYLCAQRSYDDAERDLERLLRGCNMSDADAASRVILAALDDATAQGRADMLREVIAELTALAADEEATLEEPAGQANFVHHQGVAMGAERALARVQGMVPRG